MIKNILYYPDWQYTILSWLIKYILSWLTIYNIILIDNIYIIILTVNKQYYPDWQYTILFWLTIYTILSSLTIYTILSSLTLYTILSSLTIFSIILIDNKHYYPDWQYIILSWLKIYTILSWLKIYNIILIDNIIQYYPDWPNVKYQIMKMDQLYWIWDVDLLSATSYQLLEYLNGKKKLNT